jgi:hypothetical protein
MRPAEVASAIARRGARATAAKAAARLSPSSAPRRLGLLPARQTTWGAYATGRGPLKSLFAVAWRRSG